ncbi:Fpg/Nei family DNA glycosylase [Zhihengliuella flava]|uniref:DNA-(apurinic or apyrimidinic site) lyase n=1 Tax=Zhihengliuella flava TaxID=1285193 RepID=A0A931D9C8_9MICC|nr:formamidopyrimidine-DNA glycosylase [Zhihengliuella flava]
MPEGHSIHRLARQLTDVFAGQRVIATSPQGRFAAGAELLTGRSIRQAQAHGKQLFVEFAPDATDAVDPLILRVHLGLYGAFSFGGDEHFRGASSIGAPRRIGEAESAGAESGPYAGPPAPVGAVRLRLESEHGWADLRGASACEVLTAPEAASVRDRLGPDPLAKPSDQQPGAAEEEFVRRLGATRTMIGVALMDQSRVAGVGNIHRAESLFRCGVDPWVAAGAVDTDQLRVLWADLVDIMHDGVRDGRIVTTEPGDRDPDGELWPSQAHYVYQRQGQECRRCGATIRMAEVSGRKLYWCPQCQR